MGFTYNGDAVLGVSLSVETPKPLDSRSVVNSIQDLYTIPEKHAYEGMTVANKSNGNIYMLIDKANIGDKKGWKASYEAIQIIACTEDEYKQWKDNTGDNFQPINPEESFIHEDTYYYIYEDSLSPETEDQEYLSAAWGRQIEEQLKSKALNTTVVALQQKVDEDIKNLADNYTTTQQLQEGYYNKTEADEKFLTIENADNTYATKQSLTELSDQIAEEYVTKEDLRGDSPETGDDDFIFVTQKKYQEDKDAQAIKFETQTLITDNTVTSSITIQKTEKKEISQEEGEPIIQEEVVSQNIITTENNKLLVDNKQVALTEEVPKIVCLPQDEYNDMVEQGETEDDTYYYTYNKEQGVDTGYVTPEYLNQSYYTKYQVDELIKQSQVFPKIEFIEIKLNDQNGDVLESFLVGNRLFTMREEVFLVNSQKEKVEEEVLIIENTVSIDKEILIT